MRPSTWLREAVALRVSVQQERLDDCRWTTITSAVRVGRRVVAVCVDFSADPVTLSWVEHETLSSSSPDASSTCKTHQRSEF